MRESNFIMFMSCTNTTLSHKSPLMHTFITNTTLLTLRHSNMF